MNLEKITGFMQAQWQRKVAGARENISMVKNQNPMEHP